MKLKSFKKFLVDKSKLEPYIFIFVAALYLFIFLIPGLKTFFVKLIEAAQLKARIVKTEQDWANISSLRQQVAQLNEKIDSYEKKLPGEKEIPAILQYLTQAAKEVDVKITEIEPVRQSKDEDASSSFYYKVPISLTAESGYHQLGRFINKLENADRFMKISEIKIVANPGSPAVHYVRLTVLTYVMRQ